ncbi:hypothetical protein BpHYR1_053834 [Brachionus plicatilis]|uniref:Uncharacterized protein n=1 Tax=Brachionus plicatilis TaxID=10195 RepID=A0A3M7R4R7_BRAPC|nr:hypothetical protein BpHYR1_053834 [Brachionus plicatilis]
MCLSKESKFFFGSCGSLINHTTSLMKFKGSKISSLLIIFYLIVNLKVLICRHCKISYKASNTQIKNFITFVLNVKNLFCNETKFCRLAHVIFSKRCGFKKNLKLAFAVKHQNFKLLEAPKRTL